MPVRRRPIPAAPLLAALLTALLTALVTGCGRDGPAAPAAQPPPAAEPAEAPPVGAAPAGRLLRLPSGPEGMVADPVTGTLAVALRDPDRVALLDTATLAVRAEVPLPGAARHLALAADGGPLLVPVETADRLLQVALPGGEVVADTPVGRQPHDAAAVGGGRVVVADELAGQLSLVDGGRVLRTVGGLRQPGGVATAGDRVGVVDTRGATLTVYDAGSLERVNALTGAEGPTHLVSDRRGRFVVVDTCGGQLLVVETAPRTRLTQRLPLAGSPYGIAYDADRDTAWVTLTGRNELVGFDLSGGAPREVARRATVAQPNTVAVDRRSGRVFVGGQRDGQLQVLDP